MSKIAFDDMTVFEQARWYSLLEAVNIIADECESRNKSFDKMKISPLDVEKYIEGTCDIFARKIEIERETSKARSLCIKLHNIPIELQEA